MAASSWNIRHGDSSLKLIYSTTYTTNDEDTKDISIDNLLHICLKIDLVVCPDEPKIELSITSTKHELACNSTIKMNIVSHQLDFSEYGILIPDNWSEWQLMGSTMANIKNVQSKMYNATFDLHINAYEIKIDTMSVKLYSDTDFTDYCLTTSEGNVAVHKSFMAAHSDVFKTMLNGEWKETAEGKINMKGVTLKTLHHLKDYMYLGKIPDDGLCPLLLVAKRFLIEELAKLCIRKLAETVKAEDLYSLIQFSCENNIPELAYAILHITQDKIVEEGHKIKKEKLETKN